MDTKKLMVVAVVAVMVVAGAAVFFIVKDKDDETRTFAGGTAGCLQVYGNANNDYYIDNDDVKLIEKIISEETAWKTDYPFADANYDGTVNNSDVEFVEKIIDATPTNKAKAYFLCYANNRTEGYVESARVPVTAAAFSFASTTLGALNSVGIVNEFVAVTKSATWSTYTEPLMTEKYKHLLDEAHSIGTASVRPDATIAANFITGKENPLTMYLFSAANPYDYYNVRPSMNSIGVDIIQISDSAANPLEFASSLLALGFMFGTDKNNYYDTAVKAADWMFDFNEYLNKQIKKIDSGEVTKLNAVATTSANTVSVGTSSNVTNLVYMGLGNCLSDYPAGSNVSAKYNPDTDQWLNEYNIDVNIAMSSVINDGWSWFTEGVDVKDMPEKLRLVLETYKTLKNYENSLLMSLTMPAPLRDIVIMEFSYPDLIPEGTARDYVSDYFVTFYGCSESLAKNMPLYATPADLGLI